MLVTRQFRLARGFESHPRGASLILRDVANSPEAWSHRAGAADPWTACGWSAEGQAVRFSKAIDMLDPRPGERILDFGSGTGELSRRFDPSVVEYVGYDWSPGMVARARRDHPEQRFDSELPLEQFDLIACIGPFNLPAGWSIAETGLTLLSLWDQCRRAMFVSLYSGDDERCIRYSAPIVADLAERLAGRWTLERHMDNDLALVVRR